DFGQGGDSSRFSLAGDVESRSGSTTFTEQLFLISNTSRLRENFTGYLLDVQTPLQEPHPQRGDLLDLNVTELTIGSKGAAHLRGRAFGQRQELELGYFARGDHVDASQQRLAAVTNHPYATEANLESQLGDLGLYGDVDLHATKWLGFRGGARADLFTFNVLDKCAVHGIDNPSKTSPPGDASCLDQEDFGKHREANQRSSTASTAVLPRGSIILGPWSGVTFSGSYGQGVRSIDPSYITQDIKTPFASVTAYEGGAAYAGEFHEIGLVARSVLFQTHVDKDLVFSETEGRNVLGVGTTRTGWAGALRATGSFFDESANVTFVKSTYDDTHLLVAYVPNVVVRSDTAVFTDFPWSVRGEKIRGTLSTGLTYVGKRALPYGQVSDTIFTVDSSATLAWTRYEVGLIATNLFDRRYRLGEYNFVSSFQNEQPPTLVPMRHFAAGAPRGIFATFAINFGGP
ncbi:MAG: TonB-dependent receptor, partial [Polyangiaceae bacterium]